MKTVLALLIAMAVGTACAADGVFKVVQVLNDGVLATGYIETDSGELQKAPDVVKVLVDTDGIVDGQTLQFQVAEEGTFNYTSIAGVTKTIRVYRKLP